MNLNSSVAGMTDALSDYVGLKSGLVVTAADVVRILDRDLESSAESEWWYSPRSWLHEAPDRWVRVRAEDFESLVMRLLYSVGALPSPWNQMQLLSQFAQKHPEVVARIPPDGDEDDYPFPVTPQVRLVWLVASRPRSESLPPELRAVVADYERRSIIDLMSRTERRPWDGAIALQDLFDIRDIGGDTTANGTSAPLIDQRFIDYLQAQPEDLSRMHWRQFEFLVGEFFRRHGYDVNVTPPSGDGGIDVRAVRKDGATGPELVLIQAKRLADHRQVGIETVKALWSDIDEAKATRGLIATTSTLAAGARAYCEARQYRLTAAERPALEQWLKALATHPR